MSFAVYAMCLAVLLVASFRRPAVSVAAVACMYGLDQLGQVSHPWLSSHLAFTNYAVALILLVGLVRAQKSFPELLSITPPATGIVVALYGYALLSLAWTPALEAAWRQWAASGPYVALVALASPLLITCTDDLKTALRWTVGIGTILTLTLLLFCNWGYRGLIVLNAAGAGIVGEEETNPLALAGLAGVVAASVIFVGFRKSGVVEWIIRLAVCIVCVSIIIRSGSRGQLVAAVVSIVLMMPVRFPLGRLRGLLPALLLLVGIVLAVDIGMSSFSIDDPDRWSEGRAGDDFRGRLEMISSLLSAWSSSPLTLVFGLGTSAAFDKKIVGIYPHNMPAEVLGELGFVGFALLCTFLVSVTTALRKALRGIRSDPEKAGVLAAAGASFAFLFLLSLKQGFLIGDSIVFMSGLIVLRASQFLRLAQRERSNEDDMNARPVLHPNLLG